jgi:hypothetical protein
VCVEYLSLGLIEEKKGESIEAYKRSGRRDLKPHHVFEVKRK